MLYIKKYPLVIILFMAIFNFYIPSLGPALYVSIVLSLVYTLFNIRNVNKYRLTISKAFSKYFLYFVIPYAIIIFIVAARALFSGAEDLSYLIVTLKMMFFCVSILLIPINIFANEFLLNEKITLFSINKYLYSVISIQSLIIVIAALYPGFAEGVKEFQNNTSNESSLVSEGLRGIALSSMQYYGLACFYCITLILLANDFVLKRISIHRTVVLLIVLSCSAIFISRTSLMGIVIFFLYIINPFAKFSKKRSYSVIFVYSACLLIAIIIAFIVFPVQVNLVIDKVIPWAFEFVYRFQETGGVSTASTDVLRNMYFPLEESTYLFGDGRYVGSVEGTYYMNTDAGYMRPVLYSGIGLLISMMLLWFLWLKKICAIEQGSFFLIALVTVSLLLQYKGEFIMTNFISAMSISILLFSAFLIQVSENSYIKNKDSYE